MKHQENEWRDRLTARLLKSNSALNWLQTSFGVTLEIIKQLALGLSPAARGRQYTDALVFPVMNSDGFASTHCLYYNIPGVTSWSPGVQVKDFWGCKPVRLYCSGSIASQKSTLLLVSAPTDVWRAIALLQGCGGLQKDVVVMASSHGPEQFGQIPQIQNVDYWRRWERVVLEKEFAEKYAESLFPFLDREVMVTECSLLAFTANDSAQPSPDNVATAHPHSIEVLLKNARPLGSQFVNGAALYEDCQVVDPRSAYHKGHLYYAFEQLVRGVKNGVGAEEYQSFVVKSDRSILKVVKSPRLTGKGRDVFRLTDGTLVSHDLRALRAEEGSWDASSIHEYVDRKDIELPSLAEQVNMIIMHLKASVWLPFDEDYTAFALGIHASYSQEIYAAVPLFLLIGPPGSGKTVLGDEASRLGCNGRAMGRTTIAALSEAADWCRGLISIDDLEEVAPAKSTNGSPATNPFQQLIKTSYKKAGGTQALVGDRRDVRIRNLYGVKVINNTKGVDPITATRVIIVHTRCRNEEAKREMEQLAEHTLKPDEIRCLRHRMHHWVFSNHTLIAATYKKWAAACVERIDEIAAPLRTLAELTGHQMIKDKLERVLERHKGNLMHDQEIAFRNIVQSIISRGFVYVAGYQLANEFYALFGVQYQCNGAIAGSPRNRTKQLIGKLIQDGWVIPKPLRPRLNHDVKARIRVYRLRDEKIKEVMEAMVAEGKATPIPIDVPDSFCKGCSTCPHKAYCSLLDELGR